MSIKVVFYSDHFKLNEMLVHNSQIFLPDLIVWSKNKESYTGLTNFRSPCLVILENLEEFGRNVSKVEQYMVENEKKDRLFLEKCRESSDLNVHLNIVLG